MRDALKLFEERVKADCGLALNRSKSEFYIPSLPVATQEAPAMLRAGLAEGRDGGHRGVLCVGIPLGTDAYVEHVAQRKAAAAKQHTKQSSNCRATGTAQDIRVCQWITKKDLHQYACYRE